MDLFLFNASSFLCLSGCDFIKKNYHVSLAVISILNDDGSIVFHSSHNDGFLLFLKIKLTIVRVTY